MSVQTKEQSIGYILKALLGAGSNNKEMRSMYFALDMKIDAECRPENEDTRDFAVEAAVEKGFSEEKIEQLRRSLWWAYDDYTVEEAEEFYHAFKLILRVS